MVTLSPGESGEPTDLRTARPMQADMCSDGSGSLVYTGQDTSYYADVTVFSTSSCFEALTTLICKKNSN